MFTIMHHGFSSQNSYRWLRSGQGTQFHFTRRYNLFTHGNIHQLHAVSIYFEQQHVIINIIMNAYAILGIKPKTNIGTNLIMSLRSVYW